MSLNARSTVRNTLELLYSWVDANPLKGTVQYRIKQINDQGELVAQAEPSAVEMPDSNPLFIDKNQRMVQVK